MGEDALTTSGEIKPPKTAGSSGGSHMATVRSLGLMHDLQEYIVTVEAIAAKRKSEIDRLKEEKRELEKLLSMRKADAKKGEGGLTNSTPTVFGPKTGFGDIANLDISPKVRAIVEDNRMLREELKVARDRIRGHEKTIQAQQLSINKMKEQVDNLNDQLKACALQPADFQSQAEMEATINAREGSVKELESKVGVLSHKLETDSKRAKDDLRSKDREIAEIKRKLGEKTSALEAKDKELRAKVLEWKGVNKKLDSTRRILTETKRDNSRLQEHLSTLQQGKFGEDLFQKMEAAQASRVHVMLCVLHGHAEVGAVQNTAEGEGGHKTGNAEAKPKMDPDVAATQVQSMYRGHLVRRQMEHKNRAEEEAAAIKIQAQARGHLAWKEMERIDSGVEPDAAEAMEEAAVKIQAGVRGHLARKEVANRRLAAQAALQSSQAAPARFEATAVSNKAAKEDKKSTSPGAGVARGKGANAARAQRPTNAAQSTKFAKK